MILAALGLEVKTMDQGHGLMLGLGLSVCGRDVVVTRSVRPRCSIKDGCFQVVSLRHGNVTYVLGYSVCGTVGHADVSGDATA